MGGFLRIPIESRLLAVEQDVVVRGDGPQVVRNHDLHGVHARTQRSIIGTISCAYLFAFSCSSVKSRMARCAACSSFKRR